MEVSEKIFGTCHYITLKKIEFENVNGAGIENRVSTSTFL